MKSTQTAILAGGCFWGMEELFRKLPGVIDTKTGYTGGENTDPTYQNHPGHAEALKITFDPHQTSYKKMLDFFFRIHNPTTLDRQGNDIGTSYRSAIFPIDAEQKKEAEDFIELVGRSGKWVDPVVTTIEPFIAFTEAEAEHQDYLKSNPGGYTCHFIRLPSYIGK